VKTTGEVDTQLVTHNGLFIIFKHDQSWRSSQCFIFQYTTTDVVVLPMPDNIGGCNSNILQHLWPNSNV